uniref:Uncharacterized protein n=1 Tax=Megaselia scalaris TaxID=36166 RepID=T1GD77_MEGSC
MGALEVMFVDSVAAAALEAVWSLGFQRKPCRRYKSTSRSKGFTERGFISLRLVKEINSEKAVKSSSKSEQFPKEILTGTNKDFAAKRKSGTT